MQKFQSNLLKTSESDAAFHQILKTSCLLTELQGKKSQNLNVNQQNLAASNLEFLLNIFANTNIFPDILKLESLNNNFYMNPLKMLSFLAENQKEISSTLYNTVMSKKSDNNFTLNKENNINPNFLNNNYRNSTLDRNCNFLNFNLILYFLSR